MHLFGSLLLFDNFQVELKLLALQDVAVATTALARAGRNASQKSAADELLIKGGVKGSSLLSGLDLALHGARLGGILLLLGALLLADLDTIVGLVPGSERGGVNLDDSVLHQGLGSDKLVIRSVVDNIKDTGLLGAV